MHKHAIGFGKRIKTVLVSTAIAATAFAAPLTPVVTENISAADTDNYAKLLQYSMYLYDANMCGSGVESNCSLDWRGNCHTGDDCDYGFHDAGDHVKFGLPQGYSASTLGWGYYEFKDVYDELGQTAHLQKITDYFCAYFKECAQLSGDSVSRFCYQNGNGDEDHGYWGSPETQGSSRPSSWTSGGECDIAAEYAASLALNYINFGNPEDLTYAKALFNYANKNRQKSSLSAFYKSDGCEDDIAWAAGWLAIATKDNSYVNIMNSTLGDIGWTHCWNDVKLGAWIVKGHLTGDYSQAKSYVGSKANGSGYFFQDKWGSARYNAAMQLCALALTKAGAGDYKSWAQGQMNYLLGENPARTCFVVGFSGNSSKYPHHCASSGAQGWEQYNNMKYATQAHVLVGALVGGPTDQGGSYNDALDDYVANEVAVDYNAGLVGAAAGLYSFYKTGSLEKSIPGAKIVYLPSDQPKQTTTTTTTTTTSMTTTTTTVTTVQRTPQELVIMADPYKLDYKVGDSLDITGLEVRVRYTDGSSSILSSSEYSVNTNDFNSSSPRNCDVRVSYRGLSASFTVYITEDPAKTTTTVQKTPQELVVVADPYKLDYKVGESLDLNGLEVRIRYTDGTGRSLNSNEYTINADPFNSPGEYTIRVAYRENQGMQATFKVYVTGDGQTTTTTNVSAQLYGDFNCDGSVLISDLVLMARYVAEDAEAPKPTAVGLANGDCVRDDKINSSDITALARFLAHLISQSELGK